MNERDGENLFERKKHSTKHKSQQQQQKKKNTHFAES
jgi:hypothetical protein